MMKNTANNALTEFGSESGPCWERIACLREFMMPERYEVLRKTVGMRTRYMTVLAENMYHGQNAAALIRHCEAFGVQEMHTVEALCSFEPNPDIARGAEPGGSMSGSTPRRRRPSPRSAGRVTASWPTTPHREDVTPETFDVARGLSRWFSARSMPEFPTR